MYGIISKNKQFISDSIIDSFGESKMGLLAFKNKKHAIQLSDEMNNYIQNKKSKPYSVIKINNDDISDYGVIINGVWKAKL